MVNDNLDKWAHKIDSEDKKSLGLPVDDTELKSILCRKCMKCCMSIGFPFYKPGVGVIEFYKTRGAKIYRENRDIYLIVIENKCPHLDLLRGCDIYETRPIACREFDGRRSNSIKEECLWQNLQN
jgi:Fe-S-cluster containining protein